MKNNVCFSVVSINFSFFSFFFFHLAFGKHPPYSSVLLVILDPNLGVLLVSLLFP